MIQVEDKTVSLAASPGGDGGDQDGPAPRRRISAVTAAALSARGIIPLSGIQDLATGSRFLAFFVVLLIVGACRVFAQASGGTPDLGGHLQCADRLRAFITEMDEKLESSSSIDPLQETVRKYFPLYGCNVEEAISIAQTSKYFDHVFRVPKDVGIVLRRKIPKGWGFKVVFGLKRDTGDSFLPAALVDMLQQ